ncbi:MAG: sulfatase [Verrucomicrobia bacterium]|nr:sulfatase [Verrucomicrobiota bacterium]
MKRFLALLALVTAPLATSAADRPNILWLTCEDTSPNLGCYGDAYAVTPNLDRFAARSLRYTRAWSCAPVCAPARTTIISGVYPTSTGSHHMRSNIRMPAFMRMYPQFLREAGYYCSNNAKEDYNLIKPDGVWDESSRNAHYKNRRPGQPFFAVFNHEITHESRIRSRPHTLVHDPAKVRVPAYHPDTPEVRHDWAQYHDNITTMDGQIAAKLKELEDAGLAEDTIIFFYGDHGSGMPRSKRWPYNSGLHVPLIVHVPEKWRHLAPKDYKPGGATDRLVSFVDFAPTLCSLVGIKPPDWMQGHAFMGRFEAAPQPFVHGFRGRMDERYDSVRSVTDGRYVYIRNYMPHLIYGQHLNYMWQTPTTRAWEQGFKDGKLTSAQAAFWKPKAPEELYDLTTDRDEANNLAGSPQHRDVLEKFRKAQREHALRIRDVGLLPEAEMHRRSAASTPYELGHDAARLPLGRILDTAELASSLKPDALPKLKQAMNDPDSGVRYWGVMGVLMRGRDAANSCATELNRALTDESPSVRIMAAQALALAGGDDAAKSLTPALLALADTGKSDYWACVEALNVLDSFDRAALPFLDRIKSLPATSTQPQRVKEYVPRLLEKILADLK